MYTKFTNVSKSKTDHDRCWQGPSTDLGGPCFQYLNMGPKSGPFFGLETGVVLATPQHWVSFFWARFYDQKTGLVLGPRFPAGMDGAEGQLSFTESSATHREQLYDNTTNGTLQLLRVAYTSTSDTHMKTVCCFYNDQPNSSFARLVSLQLRTSAPLPTPIRKLCSIQIRAPAFVFTKAMPTNFHAFFCTTEQHLGSKVSRRPRISPPPRPSGTSLSTEKSTCSPNRPHARLLPQRLRHIHQH